MPQGSFLKSDISNEALHCNRSGDGSAEFAAGREGRDRKLGESDVVSVRGGAIIEIIDLCQYDAARRGLTLRV